MVNGPAPLRKGPTQPSPGRCWADNPTSIGRQSCLRTASHSMFTPISHVLQTAPVHTNECPGSLLVVFRNRVYTQLQHPVNPARCIAHHPTKRIIHLTITRSAGATTPPHRIRECARDGEVMHHVRTRLMDVCPSAACNASRAKRESSAHALRSWRRQPGTTKDNAPPHLISLSHCLRPGSIQITVINGPPSHVPAHCLTRPRGPAACGATCPPRPPHLVL